MQEVAPSDGTDLALGKKSRRRNGPEPLSHDPAIMMGVTEESLPTPATAEQAGIARRFVAFELVEKAVPRHGFRILDPAASQPIGDVTSGNLSPILQKGIGLGYVPARFAEPGTSLLIEIRSKSIPARVVKPPFYQRKKT